MASSRPSRLTALQHELLEAFCRRQPRFFLTGGGALAGFYLGHRSTEDLDFFSPPGADIDEASRALREAAREVGSHIETRQTYADFRRYEVRRSDATCIVDLVIDRAPMIDAVKTSFGNVQVDTLREIAANKICALLSRAEIKDLVDIEALAVFGIDLGQALADAQRKDASVEPATLAWVLSEISIASRARLPGDADPAAVNAFRLRFIKQLRALAFAQARRGSP